MIHSPNPGLFRKMATSRAGKAFALFMAAELLIQSINPPALFALTTGPAQPETEGFQPIGVTDMVDPFTGDFSYNIPLMDVGGYPLNLSYQTGAGMDEEASWTGLGWNVHTGAITRQMRGMPDDFWSDEITRRIHMRDNLTIGAKVNFSWEAFGFELSKAMGNAGLNVGFGIDISYNNYRGIALGTSTSCGLGPSGEGAKLPLNVGLSMATGPDGLSISPNVSFTTRMGKNNKDVSGSATLGFGFSMNSRAGLSGMTLSHSYALKGKEPKKNENWNKSDPNSHKYIASGNSASSGAGGSSSISFGQTTYSPQIDLPLKNFAGAGSFKFGASIYGQDVDVTIGGYGSKQWLASNTLKNPAYGYMYSEKGGKNPEAIHDFNREKDGSFTKEKKNLALANFTYDLFSISAQGLGGSFRAYRNDAGYIYDKHVFSPSTSIDFGVELGAGNIVDFGLDFSANILESESGSWENSNAAAQKLNFRSNRPDDIRENFHLKMTGEKTVDSDPAYYNALGGKTPVRFNLSTDKKDFEVTAYNTFIDKNGASIPFNNPGRANRQPRNTAVYYHTKNEVLQSAPWKAKYISPHAKGHHIAEITVIQPDGKRYVFGLAAYNVVQKEISFNVGAGNDGGGSLVTDPILQQKGLVNYQSASNGSPGAKKGIDHYYDETETPAYAHSWMLTEVLSPDYVDVTGNGPSEDDLGSYVKFNYGKPDGTANVQNFKWRTPTEGAYTASLMEGIETDPTDDKASVLYGEKDIWYVNSIETKTQIAVFSTSPRQDALGAALHGAPATAMAERLLQLDNIKLYSKEEYKANPSTALPIKSVHFTYDYSLCGGTTNSLASGKLTLKEVYFTYRGSNAGKYSKYSFAYRTHNKNGQPFQYAYGQADRWGVYRPFADVPAGLTGSDFPYAIQDKAKRNDYSSAWALSEISLPSGGKIKVDYESDDYAFVQNKAAMRMFMIEGLASSPTGTPSDKIYTSPLSVSSMKDYLIVKLDQNVATDADFRQKYLQGYGKGDHSNNPMKTLYFRFKINVNNGADALNNPDFEYISGYAEIDGINNCGLVSANSNRAYIKIKRLSASMGVAGNQPVSPFAYSAWQFSRISTPKKAFNQPEYGEPGIVQFAKTLASLDILSQLIGFFQGPNGRMMSQGFGYKLEPASCWVRLLEPDKTKLGSGSRVKEVTISDEWGNISKAETTQQYGQEFSYLTEEGYSSGVAAYEPGTGADENAFRVPVFYSGPKAILIPEERFYLEEPFGESFFPSPTVGYSRVTIKDKSFDPNVTLNRTGKAVHEFYTAYDFPTKATFTELKPEPRKSGFLGKLLKVNARDFMNVTQGYTVVVNDMHGQKKAVSMYAEGDASPFSYTKYHYKTSGGQLDNNMEVIDRDGKVYTKPVGVEQDFVADMREQGTISSTISVTGNLATFLIGFIPVPIPTVFGSYSKERTRFRSAVTTKVIQQFGIQDRTETYDKGALVETRITAYDARTGEPLVQEVNNEFKDKYYKLSQPTHWAYTGMGQASENIGYTFSETAFTANGDIVDSYAEPGDEVIPLDAFARKGNAVPGNANSCRFWVARHAADGKKYLIDSQGEKYLPTGPGHYRIIRSGHRNMHSHPLASVTSVANPLRVVGSDKKIVLDGNSKVLGAGSTEYAEQWKTTYGMQMQPQMNVTIKYDATNFAFIKLLNQGIQNYGSMPIAPAGYSLTPIGPEGLELYPNCITIARTPQILVTTYPSGTCITPAAAGIPTLQGIVQAGAQYSSYTVNISALDYINGTPTDDKPDVACGTCNRLLFWDLTPCTGTTPPNHWSNIAYFKATDSYPYTVAGNLTAFLNHPLWANFYIITAVLNDNTEAHFLVTKRCWWIDNQFEVKEAQSKECYTPERIINPYLYGILGNWRTEREYFFMGDRNNTDASTADNLRTDGYIPAFKAYWKEPVSTTDVWKVNTPIVNPGQYENWGWKSRITLYSPYGFELENLSPIPAYSSALYGYKNTLPIAVAGNAMNKEIGYDGFEDYYPGATVPPRCIRDHFKFEDYRTLISSQQAHTGVYSLKVNDNQTVTKTVALSAPYNASPARMVPYMLHTDDLMSGFTPNSNIAKKFVLSFWAKTDVRNPLDFDYTGIVPDVKVNGTTAVVGSIKKSKLVEDWQRYEVEFNILSTTGSLEVSFKNQTGQAIFLDDIRIHPFDANIKTYVYDAVTLRYVAQLDENNFATFYEYDEEGKLIRIKQETERGIFTTQENRRNLYKQ